LWQWVVECHLFDANGRRRVQTEENHNMRITAAHQPSDFARAIAEIVAVMPVERASQVYDFARFLQNQAAREAEDWLDDSEEEMLAEDAHWDQAYRQRRDQFAALRDTARTEIEAGTTLPMFDDEGEVSL
jgi:hypothetical protein